MQNITRRYRAHSGSYADKWMTIGILQHTEQVQNMAEMITATMDDLSDQMEVLENSMENLQEEAEAIEERIDEMLEFLKDHLEVNSPQDATAERDLPF